MHRNTYSEAASAFMNNQLHERHASLNPAVFTSAYKSRRNYCWRKGEGDVYQLCGCSVYFVKGLRNLDELLMLRKLGFLKDWCMLGIILKFRSNRASYILQKS